ncbi:uncharacterized protein TNCV_1707721 [Trichonephila clavipes]|uniref:Uncharacterized protein n=1 Tax=Trichonephila clavipes TaxID=2585209 RepID=A0A8X6RJ10_TRICX|nr:uncharacterized protein TNCV_1707721 [Trichonephila clavipes]
MSAVASFCETALLSDGLFTSIFDDLVAFEVDRWHPDCGFFAQQGSPIKERRFDLGTFHFEYEYFVDYAKTIVIE